MMPVDVVLEHWLVGWLQGERVPDLGLPVDILIEETIPETAFDPPRHEYVSLVTLIQDKGLAIPMKRQVLSAFILLGVGEGGLTSPPAPPPNLPMQHKTVVKIHTSIHAHTCMHIIMHTCSLSLFHSLTQLEVSVLS